MAMDTFLSLIGKEIVRKNPDGTMSFIEVKNYEAAKYLYDLQDYGFSFVKPIEPIGGQCFACEG